MSYKVQKFPNEPIIFWGMYEGFDLASMNSPMEQAVIHLLNIAEGPTFILLDFQINMDWDDLIYVINEAGPGNHPIFNHPNTEEIITISPNAAIKAFGQGLGEDIFGNVKNMVFPTYDEALGYIRSKY